MSDFAVESGIIDANGQIPGVRVQGKYAHLALQALPATIDLCTVRTFC